MSTFMSVLVIRQMISGREKRQGKDICERQAAGFVGIELKEMHVCRALNEISIKGGRRERRQTGKACCLMQAAICCPPRHEFRRLPMPLRSLHRSGLNRDLFGRHPALSDIRIRMTPLSNAQVGLPPSRWALKATQFIFS